MTFVATPFAILFGVTVLLWLACRRHDGAKLAVLLIASLVFYGHDHWPVLGLLAAYCGVDWAVAGWIARGRQPRLALASGIAFNLGVLAYWKYTPLLIGTLAGVSGSALPAWIDSWIVPAGLSFYALTGIAYLVDVYRRQVAAEPSLTRFALYLSFFPHLMAGPILRAREFLPALQPGAMPDRPQAPLEAALLIGRGYFKKMVLADRIAVAVDPFFLHPGTAATAEVWALPYLYLYTFQIYFDFSGYTDIARGLALLFGFRWPDNFNLPYLATSVREYWQRWHITLSRFLRDYLYVPLGGNRGGAGRTAVNLMLTMLVGGLWHGGRWSFVLWGAPHGVYLLVHRGWSHTAIARTLARSTGAAAYLWWAVCVALTFHAVCVGFALFRPTTLGAAAACLRQCVERRGPLFAGGSADLSLWILLAMYGLLWWMARQVVQHALDREASVPVSTDGAWVVGASHYPFVRGAAWGTAAALLALAILLAPSGAPPQFIYFQF